MTTLEAAASGIELTQKGEAYALAHLHSREEIEAHIEDLIAMLDAFDSDPDLEPDVEDEPSIGGNAVNFALVDCELVDEDGSEAGFNGEDGPSWAETVDQAVLKVQP